MQIQPVLLVAASYLLGSIPIGLCVGRMRGVDLRQQGSGNIGATNAGRVLGWRWGMLVFAFDFAKGLIPVLSVRLLAGVLGLGEDRIGWGLACAVVAVAGHIFPLYLGFRGGKGVATAAGAFCGLAPLAAGVSFGVWLLVLLATRLVALSSILGAWAFPVSLIVQDPGGAFRSPQRLLLGCVVAVAVLITIRHRSNMGRMLRGEEPRVGLPR